MHVSVKNYALGRSALQSRTKNGSHHAGLAVDGIMNNIGGLSTTATELEFHPWWAVNLNRRYQIRYVELVYRDNYGKVTQRFQ